MTPTLSSHFVREILRGAARRGVRAERIAADFGWSYAALWEEGARVSAADFSTLVRVLWDEGGDELLGQHGVGVDEAIERAPERVLMDGDLAREGERPAGAGALRQA